MEPTNQKPLHFNPSDQSSKRATKKPRIDLKLLQKPRTDAEKVFRVGQLRNLIFKTPIQRGEIKDVILNVLVVDFRLGRIQRSSEMQKKFAFVVVADCTGTMTIGGNIEKTGLEEFMLSPDKISDASTCFFETKISGTLKFGQKKGNPEEPIISLVGKFLRLDLFSAQSSVLESCLSLIYPTSDVFDQMCDDEYADSLKFTTSLVVGCIDSVLPQHGLSMVSIAMDDPLGQVMLQIQLKNTDDLDTFMTANNLVRGACIVATGELRITRTDIGQNSYPMAHMDYAKVYSKLSVLSKEDFGRFVRTMCALPSSWFARETPKEL